MNGALNDSQFTEWILRRNLWQPQELLRMKAKEYAQKLTFIQQQQRDFNHESFQKKLIDDCQLQIKNNF